MRVSTVQCLPTAPVTRTNSDRIVRPSTAVLTVLLFFAAALVAPTSHAQSADASLWVTDGDVCSMAQSGNVMYIGGVFSTVGPAHVCADRVLHALAGSLEPSRTAAGRVRAASDDGRGSGADDCAPQCPAQGLDRAVQSGRSRQHCHPRRAECTVARQVSRMIVAITATRFVSTHHPTHHSGCDAVALGAPRRHD